jgi:hypothetical protein
LVPFLFLSFQSSVSSLFADSSPVPLDADFSGQYQSPMAFFWRNICTRSHYTDKVSPSTFFFVFFFFFLEGNGLNYLVDAIRSRF